MIDKNSQCSDFKEQQNHILRLDAEVKSLRSQN